MNSLAEKKNTDNRKYNLIYEYEKQHDYFQDAYTYIPDFIESLWKNPKIVAKLITKSDKEDIKNNLSSFFMNNFYENILSSSFIEDNLIYVISLVLIDEVENMKSSNDFNSFLETTSAGYFLEKLNLKMDVLNYYKIIMVNLAESLENITPPKKINFNVKQIQEDFLKMKEIMEEKFQKTGEKNNIIDNNIFRTNILSNLGNELKELNNKEENLTDPYKNQKRKDEFNLYIPDITKDEIEKKMFSNKNNNGMKEYCEKLVNNYKINPKIYSNDKFLANLFDSSSYQEILVLYQTDFFNVIKIIDELFNTLINNNYLIIFFL